ncbi:MAG: hydroxymethylglutaryl-CoA reductase, degradative, partial [Cyanobacteria bacterium REEB65]|nr:hydroxymethylglutaryl-CoA reductase, degradative [Cyanobacteria bacterium REEB65]
IDTQDAMGANVINTMMEGVAPVIEEFSGGRVYLRILSNLTDRCLAGSKAVIPPRILKTGQLSGEEVIEGILIAQAFAEADPYRATTHNKGVMNGIDSVVIATGNDWRAIEAGCHAYASRNGRYGPMTEWTRDAQGNLVGRIEVPMAVGTVGVVRSNPAAALALKILGVQSARELAEVIVSVGLAQNLAAIKALATEGIQRGHMSLHARNVAMSAGARGEEVEAIAQLLVQGREIRLAKAEALLQEYHGATATLKESPLERTIIS